MTINAALNAIAGVNSGIVGEGVGVKEGHLFVLFRIWLRTKKRERMF